MLGTTYLKKNGFIRVVNQLPLDIKKGGKPTKKEK